MICHNTPPHNEVLIIYTETGAESPLNREGFVNKIEKEIVRYVMKSAQKLKGEPAAELIGRSGTAQGGVISAYSAARGILFFPSLGHKVPMQHNPPDAEEKLPLIHCRGVLSRKLSRKVSAR